MKVKFEYKGHTISLDRKARVAEMYIDSKICDILKGLLETQAKPFDLTGTIKNDDGSESSVRLHMENRFAVDEVSLYIDDKLIETSKGSNV